MFSTGFVRFRIGNFPSVPELIPLLPTPLDSEILETIADSTESVKTIQALLNSAALPPPLYTAHTYPAKPDKENLEAIFCF
jgi:hypothetical protein